MSGAKEGSLTLLDQMEVKCLNMYRRCRPRVDSSHRVYVPCGSSGVSVFRCQDRRLLPAMDPLKCVGNASSVCSSTANTVFVCDWDTKYVCLVNVSTDTVVRQLLRPAQSDRLSRYPEHVSVLGQMVLVCYANNILVTYHRDSTTPSRVAQTPEGLRKVTSIATDNLSSGVLVTWLPSVFVFDDKGLWHKVYTRTLYICDIGMDQSLLWLGYFPRDIAILTSQWHYWGIRMHTDSHIVLKS